MKIAALLTGKKNSSLKNKNTMIINGKPVCFYPAFEATKSKLIDSFFVSSDSNKILDICYKLGYTKIKRPKKLSTANAKHIDVILHALKIMKINKCMPDILLVLLANSPTIKTSWIDSCLKKIINNSLVTSVVPVIKNNDHHPFRSKKLLNNYLVPFYNNKNISSNRQDLPSCYFLGHNFWVLRTREVIKDHGYGPWGFMGKKVSPFIVDEIVDIHSPEDLYSCKQWLKKNK